MERLFSIPATADKLAVSRATVYRLIKTGKLGTVRIPGAGGARRLRVPESALAGFIEEAKVARNALV